jgi:predicted SAM-dependent methyltransferase
MNTQNDFLMKIKYPCTRFRSHKQAIVNINKFLVDLRKQIGKGLHLGAGSSKLPGLINCDLFNPEADLKADASNLEMFEDGTIDLIESHHMIEHLSFIDTERCFAEWHRVLRKNGFIILTFPDLTGISFKWLKYSIIYPFFPKPDKLDYIVSMLVGSQENEGMFHKNAFDIRRMSRILLKHGFKVEFSYKLYPKRPTPSSLIIARRINSLSE